MGDTFGKIALILTNSSDVHFVIEKYQSVPLVDLVYTVDLTQVFLMFVSVLRTWLTTTHSLCTNNLMLTLCLCIILSV